VMNILIHSCGQGTRMKDEHHLDGRRICWGGERSALFRGAVLIDPTYPLALASDPFYSNGPTWIASDSVAADRTAGRSTQSQSCGEESREVAGLLPSTETCHPRIEASLRRSELVVFWLHAMVDTADLGVCPSANQSSVVLRSQDRT
jgi:hypothetical protein